MPSLTCKGGVGEGFAVPGSKSVPADAKRYYPIVSASTNSPKLAANRQCLLPNPPDPPVHKGGMAGAHIDTRYIQTGKQRFTGLMTKADMHISFYSKKKVGINLENRGNSNFSIFMWLVDADRAAFCVENQQSY